MRELIDRLFEERTLGAKEFVRLIDHRDKDLAEYLAEKARIRQQENFGNQVYLRGLIEFTNYCRNDCYYCGLRRSNRACDRYRLSEEEILACCRMGYDLDFRTFVLQGGEDPFYDDDKVCHLVSRIKEEFPDCDVEINYGGQPVYYGILSIE